MAQPKVTLRIGPAPQRHASGASPAGPRRSLGAPVTTGRARRSAPTGPAPRGRPSPGTRRAWTFLGAVASSVLAALLVAGLAALLSAGEPSAPERASVGRLPGATAERDERPAEPSAEPVAGPLLQPIEPAADVSRTPQPEG